MISVLIIDDEPDFLDLELKYFENDEKISVVTSSSSLDALDKIKKTGFDVIVSDYMMPNIDGIELLNRIRASKVTTPFIIFTGKGREKIAIEALNAGADKYLQKTRYPKNQFAKLKQMIYDAVPKKSCSIPDGVLRGVLDNLPIAAFALGQDGEIISWNPVLSEMTGVSEDELIGKGSCRHSQYLFGNSRPALADLILSGEKDISTFYPDFWEEGDSVCSVSIFMPGTPSECQIIEMARPFYNESGNPAGAIETIQIKREKNIVPAGKSPDLTSKYETGSPKIIIDENGEILYLNNPARDLMAGATPPVAMISNISEILSGTSWKLLQNDIKTVKRVKIKLISEYQVNIKPHLRKITTRVSSVTCANREAFLLDLKERPNR